MQWKINRVFQKADGQCYMQLFISEFQLCQDCASTGRSLAGRLRDDKGEEVPSGVSCPSCGGTGQRLLPVQVSEHVVTNKTTGVDVAPLIAEELTKLEALKIRGALGSLPDMVDIESPLVGLEG